MSPPKLQRHKDTVRCAFARSKDKSKQNKMVFLTKSETVQVHYDGDTGWKVYIHDARDRPTLGVSTHGTSLYHGQGRDLRLDIKKVAQQRQTTLGIEDKYVV